MDDGGRTGLRGVINGIAIRRIGGPFSRVASVVLGPAETRLIEESLWFAADYLHTGLFYFANRKLLLICLPFFLFHLTLFESYLGKFEHSYP